MAANDGQTLDGQSSDTQRDYAWTYCGSEDLCPAAHQAWEADHNNAIGNQGGGGGGSSGGGGGGGGGGGSSGGGGGATTSGSGGSQMTNPDANAAVMNAAVAAANQEYLRMRLKTLEIPQFKFQSEMERKRYRLEVDKFAFEKASEKFRQKIAEAGLTGYYKGQPILQRLIAEADATGYWEGKSTVAREAMENQTALGLLDLYSQQRGPRNALNYIRTMAGTPNGLRDILAGVMGRFGGMPGFGGGDPNIPIEGRTLQSFLQDALTGGQSQQPSPTPSPAGTPAPQTEFAVSPSGAQAPVDYYNYTPQGDGGYTVTPPGVAAPADAVQVSSNTPVGPSELAQQMQSMMGVNAQGNDAGTQAALNAAGYGNHNLNTLGRELPRGSKFIAEDFLKQNPYQQEVMWGLYDLAGHDPDAVKAEFMASLPKYGGAASGRVGMQ